MAGLFESTGWLLPLARRLLYTWVRTTVFPARTAELGIDPGKPLCYVLQDRHFSNTLLLAEEARRAGLPLAETPLYTEQQRLWSRSFFFLHRQRALLDGPPAEHRHSPLLVELIRQGLANPSLDVQLVPVVILWGRAPRQQESILKALFSENWRPPGAWRQLLTILLHGRNVLVRFNSPLSLRGLLQDGMRQEQAVRKLARVLRVHFRRQREMAIGPDLSHRHTQIDTVLSAERVQTAMAAEAQNKGIHLTEARARARHYALEIVSDYSYGVLRALELLLDWLWTRLY
ncbi:MAG TPA: glycerol-3-phosphate 1-O-acyltransferase, partial [Accumulibacter sp.]|nr:glycerol-3-phosphate 1-O-acyltransferase [Accumulibacter sp.]